MKITSEKQLCQRDIRKYSVLELAGIPLALLGLAFTGCKAKRPTPQPPSAQYDSHDFDSNGIHRHTGTQRDLQGYDRGGHDEEGFNRAGIHRDTRVNRWGNRQNREQWRNHSGEDRRPEFATPSGAPGNTLVLPATRPQVVFQRDYRGSEAEDYRRYFDDKRNHESDYHRTIILGGEWVNAGNYEADEQASFEPGYEIVSQDLADELTTALQRAISVGHVVGEREIRSNLGATDAISGAPERYRYNRQAFPRAGSIPYPLDRAAEDYLDWIRGIIMSKLGDLDRTQGQDITYSESRVVHRVHAYRNPEYPSDSGIYVNDRYHAVYRFTGTLYLNILNAIRDNHERDFLVNTINIATAFHPSRREARNGLIDAYTYLYVAKRFATRSVRQQYVHFTLNCGGIY